jgi:nucleoside-specific outer membrane channel protein Tsx
MRKLLALTARKEALIWHNAVDLRFADKWIKKLKHLGFTHFVRGDIFDDVQLERTVDKYDLSFADKCAFLTGKECTITSTEDDYWMLVHPRLGLWCVDDDGINQLFAKIARADVSSMPVTDHEVSRVLLRISASAFDTLTQ